MPDGTEKRLRIVVCDSDRELAGALAATLGLDVSAILRGALRRGLHEYERLFRDDLARAKASRDIGAVQQPLPTLEPEVTARVTEWQRRIRGTVSPSESGERKPNPE